MLRGFFGNLIFAIIPRMLSGNNLNTNPRLKVDQGVYFCTLWCSSTLMSSQFWKTKISKRNYQQKVENMKQKVILILDKVNRLSHNRAQDCNVHSCFRKRDSHRVQTKWKSNKSKQWWKSMTKIIKDQNWPLLCCYWWNKPFWDLSRILSGRWDRDSYRKTPNRYSRNNCKRYHALLVNRLWKIGEAFYSRKTVLATCAKYY